MFVYFLLDMKYLGIGIGIVGIWIGAAMGSPYMGHGGEGMQYFVAMVATAALALALIYGK